jgi:hypothetical protein
MRSTPWPGGPWHWRRTELNIIDLSHVIAPSPDGLPDFMRTEVSYTDHAEGARQMKELVGLPSRLLRNEEGPAGERLSIGTHATTHLDAPWHYNSTIGGRPAETIDELPLERFFGPGVVVDADSQIERLTNLSALPPTGFSVACFPLKIKGASAAPARVVALVDSPERDEVSQ